MTKNILAIFLVVLGCWSLVLSSTVQAQEERITITTYYPSPYGSYRDLDTQHLAVGYPAGSAVFTDNFINVRTGYTDTVSIGGDGAGTDAEIRVLTSVVARNRLTLYNPTLAREVRFRASYCVNYDDSPIITQCGTGYYAVACGSGTCAAAGTLYVPYLCPLAGYMVCTRHAD